MESLSRSCLSHRSWKTVTLRYVRAPIQCLPPVQQRHLSDDNHKKNKIKVYYGILTPQIRAVKLFSLITSVGGLAAQPILIQHAHSLGGTPVLVAVLGFVGFFTFATPFLLHLITKKYVTDISFNRDTEEYTATVFNIFLRRKEVTFNCDNVVVPEVPGMFTTFQVNGKSFFVDPRLFEDPAHFAKIMGYDKPIDFKLGDSKSDGLKTRDTKSQ